MALVLDQQRSADERVIEGGAICFSLRHRSQRSQAGRLGKRSQESHTRSSLIPDTLTALSTSLQDSPQVVCRFSTPETRIAPPLTALSPVAFARVLDHLGLALPVGPARAAAYEDGEAVVGC